MSRAGPLLVEAGTLAYLVGIPAGRALGPLGRELPLLAIMLGLGLARVPWGPRKPPPAPFQLLIPFLLFAGATILSTAFSAYPALSLSRAAYAPIALLFFFAVQEVAITPAAFRRVSLALAGVIFLVGVDGVYQYVAGRSLLGGDPMFRGRVSGSLPHPNDLALIPILLPLTLALISQERSWPLRAVLLAGLPLAFATVILSQSRNAWLGLAIGLGVFFAFGTSRKIIVALAGLLILLFGAAYALDIGNVPGRLRAILRAPSEPRIGHWLVAWEMFKEAPLLGKGTHTFGEFYLPYLSRVELPKGVTPEIARIPWAHNLFLEILAERGLLGLVGFLAPVLAMGHRLLRARSQAVPPLARTLALGLAGSLLVFLAQGLFDLTFLKDWVLLVFWLLGALVARLPALTPSGAGARAG